MGSVAVMMAALLAGCGEIDSAGGAAEDVGEAEQGLSGPTVVAWSDVGGLLQSTGNLYWTANSFSEFGGYGARVLRAAKGNVPGSELTLYQETSSTPVRFGDITYASPGGVFYGYFVADYNFGASSQIKRVPLTGGAAIVMATSPAAIASRQTLDNDGTWLFWADAAGLYKMPIGGGAPTTLAAVSNIVSIGLDANSVYFTNRNAIFSVPKAGGAVTQVASPTGVWPINAIFIQPGSPTTIYWAEEARVVAKRPIGGVTTIVQSANDSWRSTSVSFDGSRVLWTECPVLAAVNCTAKSKLGSATPISVAAGVGAGYIQGDASQFFYGNTSALYRVTY